MVGYVLLIAIAVALSSAVFYFLRLRLPSDNPQCDVDIKISIDSVSCNLNSPVNPSYSIINLNITNRGLFKVDGAYVKIGDSGRVFRETLNNVEEGLVSSCNNEDYLNPGDTFCANYNYNVVPSSVQEITVEPFVWVDNKPVLCSDAVVKKEINCN